MFNMKKIDYRKKMNIFRSIDWKLVSIICVIFLFGILILSSATHANVTGDFTQIYKQIIAFSLGIVLIIIIILFDYDSLGKYYKEIYVFSFLALVVVLIPGIGDTQYGARSWIKIGSFNMQTSEIVKTTFILSYAKIVEKNKDSIGDLKTILKLVMCSFPIIGLLLAQPDLGSAIVFFCIIFSMLYIIGLDKKLIRNVVIIIVMLAPVMFLFMAPHQRVRIINLFNPEASTNYQVIQSMIAIGSGGIFGKGLYNGSLNQENFLPVRDSDFIFAVIGEELGLVGMAFIIIMFVLLITRLFMIARKSKNTYGALIISGIAGMFSYQVIQNIGMTVGLMPVTGLTLPFVSYGGSSILTSMANIGIVLNIYLRRRKMSFYN